jgi:hypothetical protein|tara:strand:- start:1235 stop:1444 length:210 start_codon:yes stop_codon:yes gene_type:complete
MFDLTIIRRILEKEVSKMDTRKEHLGEALIFLERLEQEDYRDDEELENFELDLHTILEELQIDVDNYEE